MIKTKIIETTKKYDKDGKLFEKITREETSEDAGCYNPNYSGMVVAGKKDCNCECNHAQVECSRAYKIQNETPATIGIGSYTICIAPETH